MEAERMQSVETDAFETDTILYPSTPDWSSKMRACLLRRNCVMLVVLGAAFAGGIGIGLWQGSVTSASVVPSVESPDRWIEGKTWTFQVTKQRLNTATQLTVVKGTGVQQMLATSSVWMALQHAFDDHIPFLGRIERVGLKFYENGEVQRLNPADDEWTTQCFDVPFTMRRLAQGVVEGVSVDGKNSLRVSIGSDDFFDELTMSTEGITHTQMKRLMVSDATAIPTAYWFARSAPVVYMERCRAGRYPLSERAATRELIAVRFASAPGDDSIVIQQGGRNVSLVSSGISWFERRSEGDIVILRCADTQSVEVVAFDMHRWEHPLASSTQVTHW